MANSLIFNSKVVFAGGQPLTLPVASSDPGSAVQGDLYFNSTSNRVKIYLSGAWHVIVEDAISALTGDATASGPGSAALTLATVNTNTGTWGTAGVANTSATSVPSFTVNGKGLITAAANAAVVASADTLAGTTLASNVVSSSLTSVGTITSGTWNGTTIAIANGGTGQTTASAAFNALSPMTTLGDIIYGGASGAGTRLGIGSTGDVLTVVAGVPAWAAPASFTVGDGLSYSLSVINLVLDGTSLSKSGSGLKVNLATDSGLEISSGLKLKPDTTTANTLAITLTSNGAGVKYDSNSFAESSEALALAAGVAGDGLTLSSGVLAVGANADNSITVNANDIQVKRNVVAAVGNIIATATGIAADTDGVTLETASNKLQIKGLGITDSHISASAAIALSKLAALTINRALVSDGSGVISVSSVTSTELGYVSGVTSAIQTQLDAKVAKAGSSMDSGANITFSGGGEVLGLPSTPSAAGAAASKAYVDAVALGLAPKKAVRVATTAPLALATDFENGDSIDGVTLATGNRILIKDQATASENGIYTVNASGAPTRATDFDSISPIDEINGAWVPVQFGTANAGKVFVQYGVVATVGSSDINFEFYNPIASLIGGDMITVSGSTISIDLYPSGGLESSTGDSTGQLRIKSDTTTADTLGITLTSNGAGVKYDTASFTETAEMLKLAAGVAGDGLALTAGVLSVNVDGSTLEINADALRVKALGITNSHISASAAIDYSKLAALTANRALQSDGSGYVSASSVTNTELGYVSGVTSAIQTQLDNKATKALDNLASTAVNADINPASNNSKKLGSATFNWSEVHALKLLSNAAMLINSNGGAAALNVQASQFARSSDGSNYVVEKYSDNLSLTDNTTASVGAFGFVVADIAGLEISYVIETGNAAVDTRVGTIRVSCSNGGSPVVSLSDMFSESADCGVSWSAAESAGNVSVSYTTSSQSAARVMRADVKSFRR